jgi:hypothetical protein
VLELLEVPEEPERLAEEERPAATMPQLMEMDPVGIESCQRMNLSKTGACQVGND